MSIRSHLWALLLCLLALRAHGQEVWQWSAPVSAAISTETHDHPIATDHATIVDYTQVSVDVAAGRLLGFAQPTLASG